MCVLVLLCCQLKSDDLVYLLIQEIIAKIESGCGYQQSLPYLSLIGQLLQTIPALAPTLAQHGDSLLDYLVSGLASPSEDVKTSIVFLLARLLGPLHENDIYPQLSVQITHAILAILSSAKSLELQTNGIGLLRRLLEIKELTLLLMRPDTQPSFSSVMKKILLNRNEVLQISCVQCISQVVVQDSLEIGYSGPSHTQALLQEDMAEFLFEALSTTNDLMLGSIFCCLLLLSKHETFFTKCHTVYGIEAIVRTLQNCQKISCTDTLTQG
ncbi:meiosis inhibitor protein 1-like [Lytechinus variegatus]|uniref:meiosis inhibitor protein 1-like n=1 Tax=Lytechinus variegatus TaxID=7654 RepID=UPI001BB1DC4C|nr:meiosis inhibitor protein 1-like [Lytechinus variegatus]